MVKGGMFFEIDPLLNKEMCERHVSSDRHQAMFA